MKLWSVSGHRPRRSRRPHLYQHRDLLGKIHADEASPPVAGEGAGPTVTRASLQADLLAQAGQASCEFLTSPPPFPEHGAPTDERIPVHRRITMPIAAAGTGPRSPS